ncbi:MULTISPECIES: GNAT family N-acetyltransferase [Caballeronia]|uniref:GNAT family N-acetyltransferase n=1 Tax=Caballeronia jiangsuensis TaxID=1458357 RepID=A0ABW9CFP9_9BURK|nr:GNAT family N-acetyltransferase [Caballeronia sp. GaOx3]
MSEELNFRRIRRNELARAHQLSASLGWPHRIEEWRFAAETGHVHVAEHSGRVVGTAVHWDCGASAATVGLVTGSTELNKSKVERRLMEHIAGATLGKTVVLNAPEAKVRDYEQLGFREIGHVEQYQGAVHHAPECFPTKGLRFRPLCASDAARLAELSSQASGLDRRQLLPSVLKTANGIALDSDGVLIGFALIRRFGRGFAIGPVITSTSCDSTNGMMLINYLLRRYTSKLVRIDIPGIQTLADQVRGLGLEHVDTVIKMSRNGLLPSDPQVTQVAIISHSLC